MRVPSPELVPKVTRPLAPVVGAPNELAPPPTLPIVVKCSAPPPPTLIVPVKLLVSLVTVRLPLMTPNVPAPVLIAPEIFQLPAPDFWRLVAVLFPLPKSLCQSLMLVPVPVPLPVRLNWLLPRPVPVNVPL